MPQHFTANTVSAEFHCNKCGRMTQHRIDNHRKGPCLRCIDRLNGKLDAPTVSAPVELDVSWQMTCSCDWRPYQHQHPEAQRMQWKRDFERFTRH